MNKTPDRKTPQGKSNSSRFKIFQFKNCSSGSPTKVKKDKSGGFSYTTSNHSSPSRCKSKFLSEATRLNKTPPFPEYKSLAPSREYIFVDLSSSNGQVNKPRNTYKKFVNEYTTTNHRAEQSNSVPSTNVSSSSSKPTKHKMLKRSFTSSNLSLNLNSNSKDSRGARIRGLSLTSSISRSSKLCMAISSDGKAILQQSINTNDYEESNNNTPNLENLHRDFEEVQDFRDLLLSRNGSPSPSLGFSSPSITSFDSFLPSPQFSSYGFTNNIDQDRETANKYESPYSRISANQNSISTLDISLHNHRNHSQYTDAQPIPTFSDIKDSNHFEYSNYIAKKRHIRSDGNSTEVKSIAHRCSSTLSIPPVLLSCDSQLQEQQHQIQLQSQQLQMPFGISSQMTQDMNINMNNRNGYQLQNNNESSYNTNIMNDSHDSNSGFTNDFQPIQLQVDQDTLQTGFNPFIDYNNSDMTYKNSLTSLNMNQLATNDESPIYGNTSTNFPSNIIYNNIQFD